jgi:hypothetical protein
MKHDLRQITKAIDRLRKSDTQLTRRRARRKLRSVLAALEKKVLRECPPLRENGEPVRASRWVSCPVCGIARTPKKLVGHIVDNHKEIKIVPRMEKVEVPGHPIKWVDGVDCFCGKRFKSEAGLIRHWQAAGWKEHLVEAKVKEMENAL